MTGDDVLELHIHGGPAVAKAILNAIPRCAKHEDAATGARPPPSAAQIQYAEPGEFTRRAFLNNRLDVPQIEALGNTLAADTEQQRRLAVRGNSDSLSLRYESWRHQLLYARGELEALIDFSEDQHFDESVEELVSSVATQVRKLLHQINLHVENASRGELLRSGVKVALLGAPNAGKSSLLNRVVGREAAIVSSEEGTTRDIVDVGVDLGGWLCKFGDMAGLRSAIRGGNGDENAGNASAAIGTIEKEGIRRAKARALESDVVIVVLSMEEANCSSDLELYLEPELVEAAESCLQLGKRVLVAVNKTDKLQAVENWKKGSSSQYIQQVTARISHLSEAQIFPISCKDAQDPSSERRDPGNIQCLLTGLIRAFEDLARPAGSVEGEDEEDSSQFDKSYWEDSLGVTHRQSSNLQSCAEHLYQFLSQTTTRPKTPGEDAIAQFGQHETNAQTKEKKQNEQHQFGGEETDIDIVTAAEHLRFAADCLAKVTGRGESGDVEDVLGVVFEKCVLCARN